jgi:cell division protein FtsN
MLSGKVLLGILLVTTATGGFTLGYFVGKNVSSSAPLLSTGQPANSGVSASLSHSPVQGSAIEGSPPAVAVVPPPPLETRQLDVLPSAPQKPSADNETGKTKPGAGGSSAAQIPPASDPKPSADKKGLPLQTAVSRTAQPADQAAVTSPPSEGPKNVSASGGSSADKVVYTVQAGAFKNRKDAEALKRKLEAQKYKASVKKEANPRGVVFFKVRTGEFENKKDASAFALELKNTDGLNAFAVAKK